MSHSLIYITRSLPLLAAPVVSLLTPAPPKQLVDAAFTEGMEEGKQAETERALA